MNNFLKRGEVYWVNLDPSIGTEVKKTRPSVIISNNSQNRLGKRVIIAPVTSVINKIYPFEVKIQIKDTESKAMLDQIRTIDCSRLKDIICELKHAELEAIDKALKLVLALY